MNQVATLSAAKHCPTATSTHKPNITRTHMLIPDNFPIYVNVQQLLIYCSESIHRAEIETMQSITTLSELGFIAVNGSARAGEEKISFEVGWSVKSY
jgi:hypothetical protein